MYIKIKDEFLKELNEVKELLDKKCIAYTETSNIDKSFLEDVVENCLYNLDPCIDNTKADVIKNKAVNLLINSDNTFSELESYCFDKVREIYAETNQNIKK